MKKFINFFIPLLILYFGLTGIDITISKYVFSSSYDMNVVLLIDETNEQIQESDTLVNAEPNITNSYSPNVFENIDYKYNLVEDNIKTDTEESTNITLIDFITEWTLLEDNTTITLPITETPTITVDWGDGTVEEINSTQPTHKYTSLGTYDIKINGILPTWDFYTVNTSKDYLTGVLKLYSEVEFNTMKYNFYECINLTSIYIDISNVNKDMFYGCTNLTNIILGDNVTNIEKESFGVMSTVLTNIIINNNIVKSYNWDSDNRTATFIELTLDALKISDDEYKNITSIDNNIKKEYKNLSS